MWHELATCAGQSFRYNVRMPAMYKNYAKTFLSCSLQTLFSVAVVLAALKSPARPAVDYVNPMIGTDAHGPEIRVGLVLGENGDGLVSGLSPDRQCARDK